MRILLPHVDEKTERRAEGGGVGLFAIERPAVDRNKCSMVELRQSRAANLLARAAESAAQVV